MPQDPFRDALGPLEPLLGRLFETLGDLDGTSGQDLDPDLFTPRQLEKGL